MEFVAFGNFNRCAKRFFNAHSERFSRIAAIGQNILDLWPMVFVTIKGLQRAFAVSEIRRCDIEGMRQPIRIHADRPLDAGNPFPAINSLLFSGIGILDALRINDKKSRRCIPPKAASNLANHIFLKLPPTG